MHGHSGNAGNERRASAALAYLLSSGTVPAYPGQASGVPMGCSAVCPASGHIFIATSLAGVLVEAE